MGCLFHFFVSQRPPHGFFRVFFEFYCIYIFTQVLISYPLYPCGVLRWIGFYELMYLKQSLWNFQAVRVPLNSLAIVGGYLRQ